MFVARTGVLPSRLKAVWGKTIRDAEPGALKDATPEDRARTATRAAQASRFIAAIDKAAPGLIDREIASAEQGDESAPEPSIHDRLLPPEAVERARTLNQLLDTGLAPDEAAGIVQTVFRPGPDDAANFRTLEFRPGEDDATAHTADLRFTRDAEGRIVPVADDPDGQSAIESDNQSTALAALGGESQAVGETSDSQDDRAGEQAEVGDEAVAPGPSAGDDARAELETQIDFSKERILGSIKLSTDELKRARAVIDSAPTPPNGLSTRPAFRSAYDKQLGEYVSALSPEERLGALVAIAQAAPGRDTDSEVALRRFRLVIYAQTDIDQRFAAEDQRTQKSVKSAISADLRLVKDIQNLPDADDEGRQRTLQAVVDKFTKTLGIRGVRVIVGNFGNPDFVRFDKAGRLLPTEGGFEAKYDQETATIRINAEVIGDQPPGRFIVNALEEAYHHFQAVLVEKLINGDLKRKDSRYRQAVHFALNVMDGSFVSAEDPDEGEFYKSQPTEAQAKASSRSLTKALGFDPGRD